jgi:hypothetical protein
VTILRASTTRIQAIYQQLHRKCMLVFLYDALRMVTRMSENVGETNNNVQSNIFASVHLLVFA